MIGSKRDLCREAQTERSWGSQEGAGTSAGEIRLSEGIDVGNAL